MSHQCIIQITDTAGRPRWLEFSAPEQVLDAETPEAVLPALRELEHAVANGCSVAGYMTYEAAGGLDRALQTANRGSLPLLRFGIYRDFIVHDAPPLAAAPYEIGDWTPSIDAGRYEQAIADIKVKIARGETYQVNFTLRLRASFQGDPAGWFLELYRAQRPRYAAYIENDKDVICSVSPELFFELDRDRITCRPMKGTSQRGRTWQEDETLAVQLHHSTKNRAENLMIVDMMRNDLGRVARTGTVQTDQLFNVERFPTVLQMTSSICARTQVSLPDLMAALFPSSSITGAPKVRTMEIIKQLEPEPRGIYTGSIGFLTPHHPLSGVSGRFAQFNVAIRTAHIRKDRDTVEYGTGGGIVWDSEAGNEYRECRTKALILQRAPHDFGLLETMLWKPGLGIFLLEEHLERLETSARYFDMPFDRTQLLNKLDAATTVLPTARHRVRLLLKEDGAIIVESAPSERKRLKWRVALDDFPVDQDDPFLYHKTTHRQVYVQARARRPDADDVLLWNAHGGLTESCVANLLVLMEDGRWYTPPVQSGLLNGTLRSVLVRRGRVLERALTKDDLQCAKRVGLVNSVRGYIDVQLL